MEESHFSRKCDSFKSYTYPIFCVCILKAVCLRTAMMINNLNVYDASIDRRQRAREKGKTEISENRLFSHS